MSKLLLLDKDGTIVKSKHESGFIKEPEHQEPIYPCKSILEKAKTEGWMISICSNQGGVASNYKSLEDVFQEMAYCLKLFPEISDAWFCPDFEGEIAWNCWGNCDEKHRLKYNRLESNNWHGGEVFSLRPDLFPKFRKPGAGMLMAANYNHENVLYVGDRHEDEEAARSAGFIFMWAKDWHDDTLFSWM
jgi:D-glycero-D-manno-heptose 1,7-bisphosphate phosphatase